MRVTSAFAVGLIAAFASHFVQNTIYWGGLYSAYADLFGSAATRMGLNSQHLIPKHYAAIHAVTPNSVTRWTTLVAICNTFLHGIVLRQFAVPFLGTMILTILILYRNKVTQQFWQVFFVFISMLVSSACVWLWIMPLHVYHHIWILFRHLFVTAFLFYVGIAFLNAAASRQKVSDSTVLIGR
jgi:hypothetical protein